MKELVIPAAAARDPQAVEVIRAWIAERGLHCSLNVGMYGEDETRAWGILLADAARHVANALSSSGQCAHHVALDQIRASFTRELDKPTSSATGSFIG
ncbi:MAG: DUF5076 domain-containing protein [Sphingomonadaceae bacterium]|nr:DUF5076 domain-containing protein [Sphingomonadaceae bacterium]